VYEPLPASGELTQDRWLWREWAPPGLVSLGLMAPAWCRWG
jgi:hypothetical protein